MENKDKIDIANLVVAKLQETQATCPNGMDAETVALMRAILPDLKECVAIYSQSKKTAKAITIGVIVLGFTTIFAIGVFEYLAKLFK